MDTRHTAHTPLQMQSTMSDSDNCFVLDTVWVPVPLSPPVFSVMVLVVKEKGAFPVCCSAFWTRAAHSLLLVVVVVLPYFEGFVPLVLNGGRHEPEPSHPPREPRNEHEPHGIWPNKEVEAEACWRLWSGTRNTPGCRTGATEVHWYTFAPAAVSLMLVKGW
jgi:hypothetical protein